MEGASSVNIPPAMYKKVCEIARRLGTTKQEVVIKLISIGLDTSDNLALMQSRRDGYVRIDR